MTTQLVSTSWQIRPTSFSEAMEFAKMVANSNMVPTAYKGKPEDVLVAIQMGSEIGLAPMQALQNIAVISGKPSIYGDAALALVKASPVCEDVIEHFEGRDDTLTAVCEARRRGKAPVIARFSVADAKAAGLLGKAGPWTQYRARMLQFRARGFALRDCFPDVLKGLITAEEAQDYPTIDVTPTKAATIADDLDAFAVQDDAASEITATAEAKADEGADAFRAWWKTLSKGNRELLREALPALQARATKADEQASPGSPDPAEAGVEQAAETPPDRPPAPPATHSDGATVHAVKMLGGETDWLETQAALSIALADTRTVADAEMFVKRHGSLIHELHVGDEKSWSRLQQQISEHMLALREDGK